MATDILISQLLDLPEQVHRSDLRMGDHYGDFVRDEAQALGYTLGQVRAWEPPARVRW